LGYFCRRSTDYKERVNKKLGGVDIKESYKTDSGVSTGGQGKLLQFMHFLCTQVESALSAFYGNLFFLKTNF